MDFMKVLQQAQELQKNFQKVQDELQQMTIVGTSGGGMVTAEVTGQGHLQRIKIDPSVINPGDVEMWDPLESTCRHASLSIL